MTGIPIEEKIKELYCRILHLDISPENLSDHFNVLESGLKLDSVESLELAIALEHIFRITLDSQEINLETLSSLRRLSNLVKSKIELGK
jgi:acyl carrier protein